MPQEPGRHGNPQEAARDQGQRNRKLRHGAHPTTPLPFLDKNEDNHDADRRQNFCFALRARPRCAASAGKVYVPHKRRKTVRKGPTHKLLPLRRKKFMCPKTYENIGKWTHKLFLVRAAQRPCAVHRPGGSSHRRL